MVIISLSSAVKLILLSLTTIRANLLISSLNLHRTASSSLMVTSSKLLHKLLSLHLPM